MNLATNDLVSLRVWCRDEEQAAVNTLWFWALPVIGTISDATVAAFFDAMMAPLYKLLISNVASYLGVEVQLRRGSPSVPSQPALSGLFPDTGSGGANALPRQVTGLLSFRTATAGPAFRGRIFLPFPSTAGSTTQGEPTAPYISAIEDLRDALIPFMGDGDTIVGGSGSANLILIVRHRGLAYPADRTIVESGVARTAFGTQRRRGTLGEANKAPF